MEINVKLEISAEEFFDAIAEALVYDIQQASGKHVRAKNIKRGMSYTKKANKRQSYQVTITAYDYPKCYESRIDSAGGTNLMRYEVEPLEDGIGVTYTEELIKTNGKSGDSGLSALFAKTAGVRRTKKRLLNIQSYVLQQRQKAEEADQADANDQEHPAAGD